MPQLKTLINFQLSCKAKEAIKVALAFSIAYLIALQAGWLSPFWAALTVGQIALFPNAQSLYNGALRLAGLIPAVLVATLIFAIAGQDRWLFVSLASVWMMLATYLMIKDKKRSYMWNVAGFVTFIFLTVQFTSSTDLFNNMASRVLDAIVGIVTYTLVMVFIWPESNIGTLKKIGINLTTIQAKIFTLLASPQNSLEDKKAVRESVKQEIALINGLKQAFFAKGSETYEVQEAAGYWNEFYNLSMQLGNSFGRLNNSGLGLRNIDIERLIPEIDHYRAVINQRLKRAGDILENGVQEFKDETLSLSIDEVYLASLPPFDQLAFISSKTEFKKTEQLSRQLLRCANNIVDESVHKKEASEKVPKSIYEYLIPDIDMLQSLLFIGSFVFGVFCIWIYFDPPGHMMWFYIPPTVAMMVAGTPQMKTNQMVIPTFFILSFFIAVYSVVLPRLSGVVELFLILFVCMFLVMYYLEGVLKVVGVIGVSTKLMLTNEQTYSFSTVSNMLLLSIGTYTIVYMYSYLLDSPRPQRAMLKRIRRYHKSAQFLTSIKMIGKQNVPQTIWTKLKIAFYRYELKTLPLKIYSWSNAINHKLFPNNTPESITDLLLGLHSLSNSLEEWFESNHLPQTPFLFNKTTEELEKWRVGIEDVFQSYQYNFDGSLSSRVQESLNQHILNLEAIINTHAKEIEKVKENISEQEKENLFRLVGSYQGLSLALISYTSITEQIDWQHWQEEVFA